MRELTHIETQYVTGGFLKKIFKAVKSVVNAVIGVAKKLNVKVSTSGGGLSVSVLGIKIF